MLLKYKTMPVKNIKVMHVNSPGTNQIINFRQKLTHE